MYTELLKKNLVTHDQTLKYVVIDRMEFLNK